MLTKIKHPEAVATHLKLFLITVLENKINVVVQQSWRNINFTLKESTDDKEITTASVTDCQIDIERFLKYAFCKSNSTRI